MTVLRTTPRRRAAAGFTLVELLVSLAVSGIVLGSISRLMITQGRAYGKQREMLDARETVRSGAALLAWELRHAASGASQVSAMRTNSLAFRSVQGLGIVCARHATLPRYGLWRAGGEFQASADDSALVYLTGRDQWRVVKIRQVGTAGALSVPTCAWPGARPPDVVVELVVRTANDTSGIRVGAPLRMFRRVEYAEYQAQGRWWLGRRVGGAATYEQLTGPLLAPGSGGLTFAYYDALGAVTANPAAVGMVGFTLRTESFKQFRTGSGPLQFQRDSVTTKVALRR